MRNFTASITACIFCLPVIAQAQTPNKEDIWKTIASWHVPMPKVEVLSGNELMIGKTRCRLFGIRSPKDPAQAAKAKRFLELYMEDYGDYFSIYNTESPISDKDGVPLIWLAGHGNGGWAQEALVQAGLADIDFARFELYRFQVPAKSGLEEKNWKKCLRDAKAAERAGKQPNINFDWPEARRKRASSSPR
jgi:hypothetical protein